MKKELEKFADELSKSLTIKPKMSEREWYGSNEHFNCELSYEDYLKK